MLLLVLALGTRTNEDAYVPEDSQYKDDMLGWCDMSQWKLALRVGKSESQVQRDIKMFRKDGVCLGADGRTTTKPTHLMYKIVVDVVKKHSVLLKKKDVERPGRYKTKKPEPWSMVQQEEAARQSEGGKSPGRRR